MSGGINILDLDQQYSIKQMAAPPQQPILYLKVNYTFQNGIYYPSYDYGQSGYFSSQDPSSFCSNLIDYETNLGQASDPVATIPVIRSACYIVMAIDMNGPRSLRKDFAAASTNDTTDYDYFGLVHYQDDKRTYPGKNNLNAVLTPPSAVPCHVVYFAAKYGSGPGFDKFILYLDDRGKLDPDIRNPGHPLEPGE